MTSQEESIQKFESLSQGLKCLEIIATYPTGILPSNVKKDGWFQKLIDFFSVYLSIIEPYWSTVERYIKTHRCEVYKRISELKDIEKETLTFEQAYVYIVSWHLIEPEKFFLSIGLPPNIAHKLGNLEKDSFYEGLGSFNSTEFLKNLCLMHQLECGEFNPLNFSPISYSGQTCYNNQASHLISLVNYEPLFKDNIRYSQRINLSLDLIVKRLGLKNVCLRVEGTSIPIRHRRGINFKYVPSPEIKDESFIPDSTTIEDHVKDVLKDFWRKTTQTLPPISLFALKANCLEFVDYILFQSVYLNQKEIKSKYDVSGDIIFDYEFFPDCYGGYYSPLEDENINTIFEDMLVTYISQIHYSYTIIKNILPEEKLRELKNLFDRYNLNIDLNTTYMLNGESSITSTDDSNNDTPITSQHHTLVDCKNVTHNKVASSAHLEFPTRLTSEVLMSPSAISAQEQESVLREIFNIYGGAFEDMSCEEFLFLFGAVFVKQPASYNPPYYWAGNISTMKALLRVLYIQQPRSLKDLILHITDKETGAKEHNWSRNKNRVAYRDIEVNIIKMVYRVTGKTLKEL